MGPLLGDLSIPWAGIIALVLVLGCPERPQPEVPDPVGEELWLADYFPLAQGSTWTWRLYRSDEPGEERYTTFSLTVDQARVVNGYQVCHARLDAPWFILTGFSWLFNGADSGYLAAVEGRVYFTPDDDQAARRVLRLPQLSGWKAVPLHEELTPRVEQTLVDGESYWVRYRAGRVEELVPEGARRELLPAEITEEELLVAVDGSEDGIRWKHNRMIMAGGIGPIFGSTLLGSFYLHSFEPPPADASAHSLGD